jgi:hypothetical protein
MKLNPKQIHYAFNKYEELKNFNIVHVYHGDHVGWQFHGYSCIKCDSRFKTQQAVQNHIERCKFLNGLVKRKGPGKPRLEDEEPTFIFDKNGNEWKPFTENKGLAENYQNLTDK